jgi:hypothetical protein
MGEKLPDEVIRTQATSHSPSVIRCSLVRKLLFREVLYWILASWNQYGGKKFPTGPLFIRARELLLLCLVTVASNLVEAAVGKKQVNLDLHVAEKTPIRAQELETKKMQCFHICFQWFVLERFQFSLGKRGGNDFVSIFVSRKRTAVSYIHKCIGNRCA